MSARRAATLFQLTTAALMLACGGSDDSVLNEPLCSSGDTRACVGPAACEGGQVCRGGEWSDCNCGTGGASGMGGSVGGTGGTGAQGGTGAAGGAAAGGTGATGGAASGGTGATGGAGGSAGSTLLPDDPCPTGGPYFDCSGQCQAVAPICAQMTCREGAMSQIFEWPRDFPNWVEPRQTLLIRTPSRPGVDPTCTQMCGPGGTVFGLAIPLDGPEIPPFGFRATVDPPWRLNARYSYGFCAEPDAANCRVLQNRLWRFEVITDDPMAPARNVEVERLENPVCQ